MRVSVILVGLAGLLGAAWLVFHIGFGAVWSAAASVGWHGFALLCLYGAASFVLLGTAWAVLAPPYTGLKLAVFAWGRAVRDSAGEILPLSQLGGLVIGARATTLFGIGQPVAAATTIVDMTMEMIAQIAFILTGLLLLAIDLPATAFDVPMVRNAAVGIVVALLIAGGFVVLQRNGFAFLERISERLFPAATTGVGAVYKSLDAIHASPLRMFAGFCIHAGGWVFSAFGTWLALHLAGAPVRFTSAIVIESLLCAARSAAIFVPAAIGVQELGYMALMPLFGLPPQMGIAISLLKRAREIALGVPVLVSWQIAEGHGAMALKPTPTLTDGP